jgi:putative redox protein
MPNTGVETGVVVVRGSAEGFVQEIMAGRHRLIADEPQASGGTDQGPTPYDLLVAAFGACMSMTIALYARTKKWPLTGVTVTLRHSRIHARDCADCVTRDDTMLDRVDSEVLLDGTLTREQRDRLLEIATRCPVHRTLKSEISLRVRGA